MSRLQIRRHSACTIIKFLELKEISLDVFFSRKYSGLGAADTNATANRIKIAFIVYTVFWCLMKNNGSKCTS